MAKRNKIAPTDGLGPKEKKRLTSAIRQVWYQCRARKIAVQLVTGKDGFIHCPKCKQKTPRVQVDHVKACGAVESDGYIKRMFVPSTGLRCLCVDCHALVTQLQRDPPKRKKKTFWDEN